MHDIVKHLAPILCALLYVVDGDTIRCDGERIRIIGLDTPETRGAKCEDERRRGYLAKERLARELRGARLTIERDGTDRYGRTLARIYVDGVDIAQTMIAEGHARPYNGGRRETWCR